jgi:hypothetical protein
MTSRAEAKKYTEENLLLKKQIEERAGKSVEQLYHERNKRVRDAIELKKPDRVPFSLIIDAHAYAGVPNSAAYYDPITMKRAMRQAAVELEPDMAEGGFPACGDAMTELDVRNFLWPGGPLPPEYGFQAVEGEYMKADEYDMFLNDPTGFMIRRYLPRIYGVLQPLTKLPPLDGMYMGLDSLTPLFASPEFLEMAKHLAKAGKHIEKFRKMIMLTFRDLEQLGFPPFASFAAGGVGGAPFDTVTSFLRGMKGSMLDIHRQPDKLLQACDAILERRIARAIPADTSAKEYPQKIAMPLWRGDPTFMSEAQFKKFYWPGLKKALQTHVDLGYVPMPFFEAPFGERLKYLLELPAGKIIASIDAADIPIAKKILQSHTCLAPRCPNACKVWPLNKLEAFLKDVIDIWGKKSGLILVIQVPDRTPVKHMQAMLKSFKEYSRYD